MSSGSRLPAGVLLLLFAAGAPAAAGELHRFAVIAGNDEGGARMRPLLYAEEDARRMAGILRRLGGVLDVDLALVLHGSADDFLAALGKMERRASEASTRGERTVLFVYYSGHAKDGALQLGGSVLPFGSLKSRLEQAPADIRIGIFDACRSGLLTRAKGVRRAPAFEIESSSRDAKGLVILTSSAADEDSQESDELAGSYFSHHLATGLLGDADRSGDGRVTLSEAYSYAYDRTVADTADSAAGAQHPTFSYDLAGNGDVVMTDLQRPEGILFGAPLPQGIYYLVNARGLVAAEVFKPDHEGRRLALAPGHYRIKRRLADHLRLGELDVVAGGLTTVEERQFHDVPFSDDPVKGVSLRWADMSRWSLASSVAYQSFLDRPTRTELFPPAALLGLELELSQFFRKNWDWGVDFAAGGSSSVLSLSGLSLPYRFSELTLGTSLLVRWPLGDWTPFVGARVAFVSLNRSFEQVGFRSQSYATFTPGLMVGLRWHFSDAWALTLRSRLHYLLYNVDANRSLVFGELTLLVSYTFGESP